MVRVFGKRDALPATLCKQRERVLHLTYLVYAEKLKITAPLGRN